MEKLPLDGDPPVEQMRFVIGRSDTRDRRSFEVSGAKDGMKAWQDRFRQMPKISELSMPRTMSRSLLQKNSQFFGIITLRQCVSFRLSVVSVLLHPADRRKIDD